MGLIIVSCQNNVFDNEKALWAHVSNIENGLIQNKLIKGVDFKLMYRPTDILVKQELIDSKDQNEVDKLRAKYGEYLYFNLVMTKNGQELLSHKVGNKSEFTDLVNELSFGLQNKLHLYNMKKDTVTIADYSYPRMYGTAGGTNILLVYPRDKKLFNDEFFILAIEDLGFSTGEVRFKIPVAPILNQPELNFL